jgi:VanZ family protein
MGKVRLTKLLSDQRLRWWACAAWLGLIFFLSSQSHLPNLAPPGMGFLQAIAGHLTEYAVLSLLMESAMRKAGVAHASLWALAGAVLYGVTDEIHQGFVPGRNRDSFDLAMDALGAVLALVAVAWVRRRATSHFHYQVPRR